MKNSKKLLAAAGLAVILLGFGGWFVLGQKPAAEKTVVVPQAQSAITFSSDGKEATYKGQDGKTALEVLKSLTNIDSKDSAYGTMVTGIHGVKAEDNKTYWALYLNDAYASEGAGTLKAKNTDTVTWKLEAITQ